MNSTEWNEITKKVSVDKNVTKYIFKKEDAIAEAVLYKYPTFEERTVICCSVQSGCPVGCTFCGTGKNFIRNLTHEEIIEQVSHLLLDNDIDPKRIGKFQIMFMSMGEPFLNFKNLELSLVALGVFYPNAELLVSTCAPKIDSINWLKFIYLSKKNPKIGLQFSIHESNDESRNKLIPYERKYKLFEIAWLGIHWKTETHRKPFFNYCVHEGNNSDQNVSELLLHFNPSMWEATISVICEKDQGMPLLQEKQRQLASDFVELMLEAGYSTRMFDPAGQTDIGGGCGQLWETQKFMSQLRGVNE